MSTDRDDPAKGGAELPSPKLGVGQTVASRFRADELLGGRPGAESFLGTDTASGQKVVFIPVSAEQALTLTPAKKVEHAHLGRLLEVAEIQGGFVAIAAQVGGQTLTAQLAALGKKLPVDAVRSALRVADALNALHEAGAVHGFVHASSVIVEPEQGEAPTLAFFPAGDGEPLHAPERSIDQPPTVADDTWAAAGLLHWMLTGAAPPRAGYANESDLEGAGVADGALRTALFHTLTMDKEKRQVDLRPLRRELARWFVEHAGEEPISAGPHTGAPPPLPHSMRAPSTRPPGSQRPPPRKRRIGAFAIGAIVFGLVAGSAAAFLRPKRVKIVPLPAASAAPVASAIELGEVPVTGESDGGLGSKVAACVAGYLPGGAFGKAPALDWLCEETDPRDGAEKLRIAVVAAAPKGNATDAMKIFSRIGWYDMPAFAVVRAGCCPDAKPISLPGGQCAMDTALHDVGEAVVASKDVHEPLKKYTESIHCELNHGGSKLLRRTTRPAGGEDTAFLELIKQLD